MANTDEELKIVVSAVDNASATLKQLAHNTSEATGQVSQSAEGAGMSFGSLVGGIVSAEVAFEALKKAGEVVLDFFKESIAASMEQEKTMAQVQVNVKNAGLSFDELKPKIEAAGKANERLGFDNNDTALSLSKLTLATGNYNDAVKINALAMDLSRAKNIDLNSATVLLQQVMAGNTRVMKQYGITLDSATTSGEALQMLQDKLKGSAAAFADTTAGRLEEMKAQWSRVEEEVGDKFAPVLKELFDLFENNLPAITAAANGLGTAFQDIVQLGKDFWDIGKKIFQVFEDLNPMFKISVNIIESLGKVIGKAVAWLNELLQAQIKAGEAEAQNVEVKKQYIDTLQRLADAYNKVHKDQISVDDLQKTDKDNTDKLAIAKKNLAATTDVASTSLLGLANHIQKADNVVLKHKEAIEKLTTDYNKMSSEGAKSLATLSDEFTKKMKSINDSITKTTQSITDLQDAYNRTKKDETTGVAEAIVASENKIADLKAQLAKATTDDERANLQQQLADEQKNYDSSAAFRIAHIDEITAAEGRAKETDLQRTIDDYTAKQALEKADYDQKLKLLKQELADKQQEAEDEKALYKAKQTAINKVLDDGNAYFKKLSADRRNTTTAEVQAEIAQFQALTAAISQMQAASASALAAVSTPTLPNIPKHEAGGFINAPRGTAVPIIAHGGEEVIPAEQVGSRAGGGSTINVTINNPQVRSQADLDAMRDMVEDILRPVLLNAKVIHI